jgi:nitric oxide reductase subunit C
MSERAWRNVFIYGTLLFLALLVGMTVHSLRQVTSTRTPPVTADVASGKHLWQERNCNDCHTILGIGGYFAPDLTKVGSRRDAAWLHDFLQAPQAVKAGTTMPAQNLTRPQAVQVATFLQWVNQIDTNNWPPQPSATAGGSAGAMLFDQKGCSGCHLISGRGTEGPGPELTHIASVPYKNLPNTEAGLSAWLRNPAGVKPDTVHPNLGLTDAEIRALVQYLRGLR